MFYMQTKKYIEEFTKVWMGCSTEFPYLDPVYSHKDKLSCEARLEKFFKKIKKNKDKKLKQDVNNSGPAKSIFPEIRTFFKSTFGFEDNHLNIIFSDSYREATKKFIETGQRFDPNLDMEDILQASRNVWIINSIQSMMGMPVKLTSSIFAYSMLYPYTDNYLDNPDTTSESKITFCKRFQQRIKGKRIIPKNNNEKNIFDLIGMIEEEYDRKRYPKVYESLLAIHRGQTNSIRLLDNSNSLSEIDILKICIEKGGASVLADGYLVSGSLTKSQERFLFGFGAYLQMADDIQDTDKDSGAGLLTPFSQASIHSLLDKYVSRTFNFGIKIMDLINCFKGSNLDCLKSLIEKSTRKLLVESIGLNDKFYSKSFLTKIEEYSPFRFSYLKKRKISSANKDLFAEVIKESMLASG